ncbi:glycoside hydrolase family 19 protein [Fibrella forsythiae]|uniref:Glycoside hydrolase family 19 protein n=1 Tax=Fibrella forsythiae TaxID=2817061 RepID=A0ABS3JBW9_9BACT|nr:glycoside hydrolase family 19 protein [Fibrella forsythiae]MBO0947478.1 glycoside hydrolase family 19 protein [Fibrella forsythiae]
MQLTLSQLTQLCGSAKLAATYLTPLNDSLTWGKIVEPVAVAHYLAQILHESQNLTRQSENLNYTPKAALATFNQTRVRITPAQAELYCRTAAHKANPEMIANIVYAGMSGNGNAASGDGWRYRGRSWIQLTLKDNYEACGKSIGVDLVGNPDLATRPDVAPKVGIWYWNSRGLTRIALTDKVGVIEDDDDVCALITRRINGGMNGFTERLANLKHCKKVLGIA